DERAPAKPANQSDDLLNPTEEELRETGRPAGGGAVRGYTAKAGPSGGRIELSVDERPRTEAPNMKVAQADGAAPKPADPSQTDDLLNPTEEDARGGATPSREAERPARPEARPTQPDVAAPKAPAVNTKPDGGARAAAGEERRPTRAADQTDDLL